MGIVYPKRAWVVVPAVGILDNVFFDKTIKRELEKNFFVEVELLIFLICGEVYFLKKSSIFLQFSLEIFFFLIILYIRK